MSEGNQIQVLSELMSRAILSAKLGQQFGGVRDLYKTFGYKTELIFEDYLTQYSRQDIAAAVIDRPVDATWRGNVALMEPDDAEETPLEKAWADLMKELKLKQKLVALDKLTCLGRYGILLLGLSDIQSKEQWETPVTGTPKLLYVRPVSERDAIIHAYVKDAKDPRFGQPLTYNVTLTTPDTKDSYIVRVHYSRVIHVVQDSLSGEVEGTPVLKKVFNRLTDLEKLTGGSAEMFWKGARPGYQGLVDKDYQLTQPVKEDLQNQLDEFEHGLRRVLMNEGIKYEPLQSQVSDPASHAEIQIQMISAATGIPKRILVGSERGELASSQDQDSWSMLIQARREEYAEEAILRPFIDRLIKLKILPSPKNNYSVLWDNLFSTSEKDQAEVGRIRATALREYMSQPMAQEVVPPAAFFEFFLGLTQDQIDLITKMVETMVREDDQIEKGRKSDYSERSGTGRGSNRRGINNV